MMLRVASCAHLDRVYPSARNGTGRRWRMLPLAGTGRHLFDVLALFSFNSGWLFTLCQSCLKLPIRNVRHLLPVRRLVFRYAHVGEGLSFFWRSRDATARQLPARPFAFSFFLYSAPHFRSARRRISHARRSASTFLACLAYASKANALKTIRQGPCTPPFEGNSPA